MNLGKELVLIFKERFIAIIPKVIELIFLLYKPSKKNKSYVEKVSELIIKRKLRLHQLAGIETAAIIVPFTTDEIKNIWKDNLGKNLVLIFMRD